MNLGLLLFQFAPLVIYIMVDYFKGFRAGIYAAMLASLVVLGYDYAMTHELDQFIMGESLLIIILGSVSLRMNNDRYFKFQPTVVAWIFAAVFTYFQIFDRPLLQHFTPHMEKLFQAQQQAPEGGGGDFLSALRDPRTQHMFGQVSAASIGLFFGHGLLMAYAALRLSTRAWFAWRLAIYPAMLMMVIFYQLRA